MRILVLSQFWHPDNGVPQRRWSWLTGILTDQGRYDVTVIAPSSLSQDHGGSKFPSYFSCLSSLRSSEEIGVHGERIYRTSHFPGGRSITRRIISQAFAALSSLGTLLGRRKAVREIDLVIGTVPALPTAIVAGLVAMVFRKPYIIDLRDAWPDLLGNIAQWNKALDSESFRERIFACGPRQLLVGITRIVLDRVLEGADGIIVTTDDLRQDLESKLIRKGDVPKIVTVRNVFPIKSKASSKERILPGARRTSLNVLYAGTLGRAQNLENALQAAEILKNKGITISLKFVGAGPAKAALKKSAQAKGVKAQFLYRRPAESLYDLYDWADTALVHLTDWEPLHRTVPSKTYELIEAGVHISAVAEGETQRIISNLGAGDVVPPEDPYALALMWEQKIQAPGELEISQAGADWVRNLRENEVPRTFLNFLEEVVS